MKDALKAVRMVDVKGRVVDIPAEIPFSYRWPICHAALSLVWLPR